MLIIYSLSPSLAQSCPPLALAEPASMKTMATIRAHGCHGHPGLLCGHVGTPCALSPCYL